MKKFKYFTTYHSRNHRGSTCIDYKYDIQIYQSYLININN